MKRLIFCFMFLVSFNSVYLNAKDLPSFYNMFIGREGNRVTEQYIKPDYIRDDYKRTLPNIDELTDKSFFNKYPFEFHLYSLFSYGIHNNTFHFNDVFLSMGQTFHNKYIAFTPFVTINGYVDTHNPDVDYPYIKGNIGLYDAGVQAVIIDRILISARGKATFDINTKTFLLMPHYYDPKNPTSYDMPEYYVPVTLNGPGIRVGFIGNFYEIAYSQGDYRHSIPKAALFRLSLPNTEIRLLYEHENRKDPEDYDPSLFESTAQVSAVFRKPLPNTMWINAIAEYTFREGDAHYVRFEESFEWNIINVSLREMIYVKNSKAKFFLEYALFAKFQVESAAFSIGFQGATDGRYFILGTIKM